MATGALLVDFAKTELLEANGYPGIGKSANAFASRLNGYRRPPQSQRTNFRINPLLIDHLNNKRVIAIYHFEAPEKIMFRGVELHLAAALEDSLISMIAPAWNLQGL